MQINITYDSSVADAPAGFQTAVNAAVQYLDSVFSSPITINIVFSWGEIDGQTLEPGAVGESLTNFYTGFSYGGIVGDLRDADGASPADAALLGSLPTGFGYDPAPTSGYGANNYWMSTAEYKAIGGQGADPSAIDGYVALNSSSAFTFDPNNRAVSGDYDAIGVLEHEITEVMGRSLFEGATDGQSSAQYTPLDLFRYSAPGVHEYTPGGGNFSLNGNQLLLPFNDPSDGGDAGDWSTAVSGDSFDAFGDPGTEMSMSAVDIRVLQLLGYQVSATAPSPNGTPVTPDTVQQSDQVASGQTLNFNGPYAFLVAPTSPTIAITNAGSIVDSGVDSQIDVIGLATDPYSNSPATSSNWTFTNTATGVLSVTATATASDAVGVFYGTGVANSGAIEVVSDTADAFGIWGAPYSSTGTGSLTVQAENTAVGVNLEVTDGGAFSNAGVISITGLNAVGVEGMTSFNNSGTITATGVGTGETSVGVYITSPAALTLTNSGTITAGTAVAIDTGIAAPLANITINNSGTVNGVIDFANADNVITNTGSIVGAIHFGDGNSTYSGATGIESGGIYLGYGTNTVTLGNDGEAVYGGNGNDTITGGSGNDFFEITRGTNTINGGGGFNTLSVADSDVGVTVNLATGTLTGVGTSAISNIQQVVGSDFGDTMIAGSSAVTFISGSGYSTLKGGAGNDTLVAGAGGDTMTGGGGNNTFIFSTGDHQLTITDFDANGDRDVLDIDGYTSAQSVTQEGANTLITLSGSDSILLDNVQASSLTGSNVVYSATAYQAPVLPVSLPVFGTTTIKFTYDLTITAPETINELNQSVGFVDVGAGGVGTSPVFHSLYNYGTVHVTESSGDVSGLTTDVSSFITSQVIVNEAGATFSVSDTDPNGTASGLATGYTPAFTNSGTFEVSAIGDAYGINSGAPSPTITNNATFTVSSSDGNAYGIDATAGYSTITNDGPLSVTGAENVYGIDAGQWGGGAIVNQGTLSATGGADATTYGIYINGFTYSGTITNSGTISAQTAIDVASNGAGQPILAITNTGTIDGAIVLDDDNNSITNTGSIVGAIHFGNGNNTYNGSGGTLSGDIYLGYGTNTVTLGNDGETVFGGGGSDTITGGAGNDFIEIDSGTNTINGGGGFNTLSLADSAAGVTVNLAAGTLTGNGSSTIANIQEVIGSSFGDTMIAGASAATFISGSGYSTLEGGAGNDTLVAGTSGDLMTGGGGDNTFIFSAGDHRLTITDFDANGDQDALDIDGYTSAQSITQQGANTLITLSGTDSILLDNVQASSLAGDDIVYNATAYQPPTQPATPSTIFSKGDPLYLDYNLTVYTGETWNIASQTGELVPYNNIAIQEEVPNSTGPTGGHIPNFTNSGTINITSADPSLIGLSQTGLDGNVTIGAGGTFEVSDSTDTATAMSIDTIDSVLTNAGAISADASSTAVAVLAPELGFSFSEAATGTISAISATGNAIGLTAAFGGTFTNSGTISASAAGTAYAFQSLEVPNGGYGFAYGSSLTNDGTITATGTALGAQAVGVDISAFYDTNSFSTITNGGTITAQTAIEDSDTGEGYAPLQVTNTGTINGLVNLGASESDLTNSGTIAGNVIFAPVTETVSDWSIEGIGPPTLINTGTITGNISLGGNADYLRDTGQIVGNIQLASGSNTLDLQGGSLSGAIDIAPTASGVGIDTIYTGSNDALINIGGTDPNLYVYVHAETGVGATVAFDVASSAATETYDAFNQSWSISTPDGNVSLYNGGTVQFTDKTITLSYTGPAALVEPATATPTGSPLSSPTYTQNATVAQGQAEYFQPNGISIFSPADDQTNFAFTNDGTVTVIGGDNLESIFGINTRATGLPSTFTITNGSTGAIYVEQLAGTADSATGIEIAGTSTIDNSGLIQVVSSGSATGALAAADGYTFTNEVSGQLTVWANGGLAEGLNGGNLSNAGTITVDGTSAIGVYLPFAFSNGGTITAYDLNDDQQSIGVDVGFASTYTNTGTIRAGYSFYVNPDAEGTNFAPNYTINNSGQLIGVIASGNGNVKIDNTGTIQGTIDFGGSVSSLQSTGTIDGNIDLTDNGITPGTPTSGDTVDLRGGTYNGTIVITPGSAGNIAVDDTIYTDTGTTLITIGGGESNLNATITGGQGGDTTVELDIASTSATESYNASTGAWTVSAGTDGTLTLYDVQNLEFTDKTVSLSNPPPAKPVATDFGGTGMSDLLWQNTSGEVAVWTMDGTNATAGTLLGNVGTSWHVVTTGHFFGGDDADILWQNDDGTVAIWEMNGSNAVAGSLIASDPGPTWHVVGAGDFTGNGYSDILFQNDSGQVAIWEMNGFTVTSGVLTTDPGPTWHVEGVGDFNGDGKSDILFQNNDGSIAIWEMNGGTLIAGGIIANPGTNWHIAGVGDFNGDGKSDIVLQYSDGTVAIWEMNGLTVTAGAIIADPGPSWKIVGVGDYNGDGKSDILFQNTSGQEAIWEMNGFTVIGSGLVTANPGASWKLEGNGGAPYQLGSGFTVPLAGDSATPPASAASVSPSTLASAALPSVTAPLSTGDGLTLFKIHPGIFTPGMPTQIGLAR